MRRARLAHLLGLTAIGGLFAWVLTREGMIEALAGISALSVAGILILSGLSVVALGLQFKSVSEMFGISLDPKEWLGLTAVNTMVSYALPARGGLVVRALYMARVHGLGVADYATLTATALGTTLLLAALAGLTTSVTVLDGAASGRAATLFAVTLALLGAGTAVIVAAAARGSRVRVVARFLTPMLSGMRRVRDQVPRSAGMLAATVAFFAAQGARLWASFEAVGADVSIGQLVVMHAAASVAFVVSITPGNLGIKEGAIAFVAGLIAVDVDVALLAALVDRAAAVVVTFAIGLALGPALTRRVTNPTS